MIIKVGAGVMLIALLVLATHGCREYRIDRCEEDGGRAVVPAWFSEEPTDVRCIQGGGRDG